jgi:hypothetical protein
MRKILIIGLALIGLTSCNNQNQVVSGIVVDTEQIKIDKLCGYSNTPQGISIITIPDGKRFMYCETSHGVAITQIMGDGEVVPLHIESTPTDSIINY